MSPRQTVATSVKPMHKSENTIAQDGKLKQSLPQNIVRDVRALLHGTKDDEIVVKNQSDRVVKGKKVPIDNTQRKPRGGVKVVESAECREQNAETRRCTKLLSADQRRCSQMVYQSFKNLRLSASICGLIILRVIS